MAGSVCGITVSYALGRTFGMPLVHRYGRYVHLTRSASEGARLVRARRPVGADVRLFHPRGAPLHGLRGGHVGAGAARLRRSSPARRGAVGVPRFITLGYFAGGAMGGGGGAASTAIRRHRGGRGGDAGARLGWRYRKLRARNK